MWQCRKVLSLGAKSPKLFKISRILAARIGLAVKKSVDFLAAKPPKIFDISRNKSDYKGRYRLLRGETPECDIASLIGHTHCKSSCIYMIGQN